jgi:predicted aldo/keto reductase-like oxidoreductase
MSEQNEQILTRTMESTGDSLGILGYGCMRFKRKRGAIDMERAERQVMAAIDSGVNYFDTAYMYPGNEQAIGTILAKSDGGILRRDRVKIATKLPLMMVKKEEDLDKMFQTSLDRLKTDRIDYYLMHNISSYAEWERVKDLGVVAFIERIRQSGAAKHIGFSAHGNLQDFRKTVDDYPWDFCQIQYNYLDENFQAGTEGLHYAAEKGLGIVIMEPLRGGTLIDKMPPKAKKIIDDYTDERGIRRTPAEWGLRWVFNHSEVHVALSGMNEDAHVEENVSIAKDAQANSLTDGDFAMIEEVKEVFHEVIQVGCTGCAYCMPCPHGVNIPQCFALYNSQNMFGGMNYLISYAMYTGKTRKTPSQSASACKKCGVCEKKCPQSIPIIDSLKDVSKKMEKPWIKYPARLATAIMGR